MMDISPNAFALIALALAAVIVVVTLARKKGVFAPAFAARSVMNQTEQRLFKMLRDELPDDWTVMAQVSYGAFLANANYQRYMTVNSKRADFVILDPLLSVAVVVEYQGKGHYGNTAESRDRATKSDQVKRQALDEAGIPLYEVPAKFERDTIRKFAQAVVGPPADAA
jgi:very-short-patch-repair endonuclease